MRPLLLEFPDDQSAWDVDDQFMFGPDVLVAPVTGHGVRTREVYLPAGASWTHQAREYPGGTWVPVDAPLDTIPLFLRDGAEIPLHP
jgi:alpha-D-xyloside xylohydrolase